MILRQEEVASAEQRLENIKQGVAYAKEAVQLDTNDGISWTVLGTAYLSSFFSLSQNPHTLKLCMSAYQQAVNIWRTMIAVLYNCTNKCCIIVILQYYINL